MSRSRVHEVLVELFQFRDPDLLLKLFDHSDFVLFMKEHGIQLDLKTLIVPFTHTSFSHEYSVAHQEKLEFLGDSVLQLIVTEELFKKYPQESEGQLSKLRSSIVNSKTLSCVALGLKLNELLLVGKGEFKKNLPLQEAVMADTLEALIGQIYRFQGFEFTKALCLKWLMKYSPDAFDIGQLEHFDSKSKLQELSLSVYKKLPVYSAEAVGEKFEVKLWINEKLLASGIFSSKKIGEKELAQDVFKKGLI